MLTRNIGRSLHKKETDQITGKHLKSTVLDEIDMKNLVVCSWNIGRGLYKKETEIQDFLIRNFVDLIFLQETDFLNDEKYLFAIEGFRTIFPKVKSGKKTRILCIVKESIFNRITPRFDLMQEEFPSIWLEFSGKNKKNIIIGGYYREWGNQSKGEKSIQDQYDRLQIFLGQIKLASTGSKSVLIMGDMNLDSAKWSEKGYHLTKLAKALKSALDSSGLVMEDVGETFEAFRSGRRQQKITSKLDHIYRSSELNIVAKVMDNALSDHYPIHVNIDFRPANTNREKKADVILTRNFDRICESTLCQELAKVNWEYLVECNDINEMVRFYTNSIMQVIDFVCPMIEVVRRPKSNLIKLSTMTRKVMKQRDRARKRNKLEYKRLRNECTKLIRKDQKKTILDKLQINNTMKQIWSITNNIIKPKDLGNPRIELDDGQFGEDVDIATGFNDFFVNKVLKIHESIPKNCTVDPLQGVLNRVSKNHLNFCLRPVTEKSVLKVIKSLKNSRAIGYDGIPTIVIKKAMNVIVFPLTYIINTSILTGVFPELWKKSIVTPLFKKGDRSKISNYRPVSNLCVTSKVLEKVIHGQISCFFEENNLLPRNQFGFRINRSTQLALMTLHSKLRADRSDGKTIGVTCFDLSSAFDCIEHNLLLQKLNLYGLSGQTLDWFSSFLGQRSQCVRWGKELSRFRDIEFGTPQGSILSPFLFLVLVADIGEYVKYSDVIGYADDTTVLSSGKDETSVIKILEEEAVNILDYMASNRLAANPSKTQVMLVGKKLSVKECNIGTTCVKIQSSVEILGMKLDKELTWKNHLADLVTVLDKRTGILRRLAQSMPRSALRIIAEGIFMSKLRYGISCYASPAMIGYNLCSAMQQLQVKQNEILRIIHHKKKKDHVCMGLLRKETKTLSVNQIAAEAIIFETWKILNLLKGSDIFDTICKCSGVSNVITRSKTGGKLQNNITDPCFAFYSVKFWNCVDEDIKHAKTKEIAKNAIRNFVLSNFL